MCKNNKSDDKSKGGEKSNTLKPLLISLFIGLGILSLLLIIIFVIKFESDGKVLSFTIDYKDFFPSFMFLLIVAVTMIRLLDTPFKEIVDKNYRGKITYQLKDIETLFINKNNTGDFKPSKIEKQLNDNIVESNYNAERLFSRSGTCLIVGCVISILGVFVFYFMNWGTEVNDLEVSAQLFTILPRFGILFFIEYVAFFFLKQYRVLMEEYRYYEAIKRDRQNLLSIYYLVDKYKDEKEILELMNNYIDKHSAEIPKYSGDNRVKMEKSLNEDMDLISKIIKLVQVIKTPDKSKE